jgi:Ase1/PRC1/MAP65 family protein
VHTRTTDARGVFFLLLQVIWDEVEEPDTARDRMLLELEQECLEVYRWKVDHANRCRAQLRQAIAEAEAELAGICSAMGEAPIHVRQVSICVHMCLQVPPCGEC